MKRIIKTGFLFLSSALLFSGCSASPQTLPDDPYEAVEYQLYPAAPDGGYVGDTMPYAAEDGTLELYYLYDTDHNGQGYHPVYRYDTADFSGYKDRGMVLNYGLMSDPDPAIGTGSVLRDADGLYHMFYTGHNDTGNNGRGKECVMHATSEDRISWVKQPDDTFFAPENCSHDDFRDPEVFWSDEDQCYWMLIAARDNTRGGIVGKFTSDNLTDWQYEGPLYAPMEQYMLECPDLFRINDTWYLTYSWDCVTYYAVGESMNGPFKAPADNILDGKGLTDGNGFIFYAAKTAQIEDDTYLCGWIGRAGLSSDSGIYQWAGNVLNHQLVQLDDNTLGVKAPEALETYFTKELPFRAVRKQGEVRISGNSIELSGKDETYALADMGTRPASMTLECDAVIDGGTYAGFAFGGSENDPAYTALCLDTERNLIHYEGYEISQLAMFDPAAVTRFDFEDNEVHHIKLVCENEIVVLYIDDEKALSSRITHSVNGNHIGVFADQGSASFSNITIRIPE